MHGLTLPIIAAMAARRRPSRFGPRLGQSARAGQPTRPYRRYRAGGSLSVGGWSPIPETELPRPKGQRRKVTGKRSQPPLFASPAPFPTNVRRYLYPIRLAEFEELALEVPVARQPQVSKAFVQPARGA